MPMQYDLSGGGIYDPLRDEWGKGNGMGGPGNPAGGGVGPGGGAGGGPGGGGLFAIPSYDPTVPAFARRKMLNPGLFGQTPLALGQRAQQGGAMVSANGGLQNYSQVGAQPMSPQGQTPQGGMGGLLGLLHGGQQNQSANWNFDGYNPYQGSGGNFSAAGLLHDLISRGALGNGLLDPTGNSNALLQSLQQQGFHDLGGLQNQMQSRAQLSGADPEQIASYGLQGQLQGQGNLANTMLNAKNQLGMQAQQQLLALLQAALAGEGVQKIGKYDQGRSGGGGGGGIGFQLPGGIGVGVHP